MMPEGSVKTLLLTDLVGSTALTERLGDVRASELFARTDRIARDLIAQFNGREIDKSDGFLVLFERPIDAVRCALALHGAHHALSQELGEPVASRAAIHLGEVILKENAPEDIARGAKRIEATCAAVPTCARVMALAQGGQTLLTRGAFDVARVAARGNTAVPEGTDWVAHGPYVLKGFDEPVDVFEAGVRGAAPLTPPPDSEKARRAVAAGDEITLGWRPAPGIELEARPNWILKEKLGEGGFGEVWLVEHAKTHARRVFKFCFQADRLRGLKREVVLFRVLKETLGDRDDIAKVIDWNFEKAPFFIESEYTEGGDLLEWAESQDGIAKVPLEVRLEIVAQVAEAVGAAHSVGVLHKDIKPSNILVRKGGMAVPAMPESGTGVPPVHAGERGAPGESGARATTGRMPVPPSSPAPRIVLTDFGIGLITDRSVLEAKGITASGMTESVAGDPSSSRTGTRLYMAPELLEGKPATIQSDVYSLGIMLYQALAGDFRRALSSDWREDVEDELLREDIGACLAGDLKRRPSSAVEVASRLRSLGARREERDRARRERAEAEAAKEALEKAKRRRKLFAVGLITAWAVVLALTAGVGVLVDARDTAERERKRAEEREWQAKRAAKVAETARASAERLRAEARAGEYADSIAIAESLIRKGNLERGYARLMQTEEGERGIEFGYLLGLTKQGLIELPGTIGEEDHLEWSGDDHHVTVDSYGALESEPRVWDLQTACEVTSKSSRSRKAPVANTQAGAPWRVREETTPRQHYREVNGARAIDITKPNPLRLVVEGPNLEDAFKTVYETICTISLEDTPFGYLLDQPRGLMYVLDKGSKLRRHVVAPGNREGSELKDFEPLWVPFAGSGSVLTCSPDRAKMLISGPRGAVVIDLERWEVLGQLQKAIGSSAWSPDSTRIAHSLGRTIEILRAPYLEVLREVGLRGHVSRVLWDHSSTRMIAVLEDDSMVVVDGTVPLSSRPLRSPLVDELDFPVWTGDGEGIILVPTEAQNRISRFETSTGTFKEMPMIAATRFNSCLAGPQCNLLLVFGDRDCATLLDASSLDEVARTSPRGVQVVSACWSPDGTQFALLYRDTSLSVCNGRDATLLKEIRAANPNDRSAAEEEFKRSGEWGRLSPPQAGRSSLIAWRPDGAQIMLLMTAGPEVFDVESGRNLRAQPTLHGDASVPVLAKWSPDGKWIAELTRDGSVVYRDALSFEKVWTVGQATIESEHAIPSTLFWAGNEDEYLVIGSGKVLVLDSRTGQEVAEGPFGCWPQPQLLASSLRILAIHEDKRGAWTPELWQLPNMRRLASLESMTTPTGRLGLVEVSPQANRLARVTISQGVDEGVDSRLEVFEIAPYRVDPTSKGPERLPLEEQFKIWKLQRYRDWQVRQMWERARDAKTPDTAKVEREAAELTEKFRVAYPEWAAYF